MLYLKAWFSSLRSAATFVTFVYAVQITHNPGRYVCIPLIGISQRASPERLILLALLYSVGRDSSVGIATCYVLNGPGIESRLGARFSAPVHTGPGAHPAACTMGAVSFSGLTRSKETKLPVVTSNSQNFRDWKSEENLQDYCRNETRLFHLCKDKTIPGPALRVPGF